LELTNNIEFPHNYTPIIKIAHIWQRHFIDMTLPKEGDFYTGVLWGNVSFFVEANLNFISDYVKNVDTYHVSFS